MVLIMNCKPETSSQELGAYIGSLSVGKNRVSLRDPFLGNVLHQGCGNAPKDLLQYFCLGQGTIPAPKIVFKMSKGRILGASCLNIKILYNVLL